MLDATGKLPDGVLGGNTYATGSYQSCLDVKANPKDSPSFSGKYAGAAFYGGAGAEFGMNLKYGICLPDSCTDQDFTRILYAIDAGMGPSNHYIAIKKFSTANESYKLDGGDILMM